MADVDVSSGPCPADFPFSIAASMRSLTFGVCRSGASLAKARHLDTLENA